MGESFEKGEFLEDGISNLSILNWTRPDGTYLALDPNRLIESLDCCIGGEAGNLELGGKKRGNG